MLLSPLCFLFEPVEMAFLPFTDGVVEAQRGVTEGRAGIEIDAQGCCLDSLAVSSAKKM